jgi:hypothetical protein
VADLELPAAVFKTCPWQPHELIETGLRQWLRCCAAALKDDQFIGMPSRAVDESWHGLILCTIRYRDFCTKAYGQFLHHHPSGGEPTNFKAATNPLSERRVRVVGPRRAGRGGSTVGRGSGLVAAIEADINGREFAGG